MAHKKKKKTRVHAQRRSRPSRNKALVCLNSTRLRKQWLTKLKSAEHRFSKAQEEWLVFQQQDAPAFERWRHLLLGPMEQEIGTLRHELNLYQQFMTALRQESHWARQSATRMIQPLLAYAEQADNGQADNKLRDRWSPAYLLKCMDELWVAPRIEKFRREEEEFNRQWEKKNGRRKSDRRNRRPFDNDFSDGDFAELDDVLDMLMGGMFGDPFGDADLDDDEYEELFGDEDFPFFAAGADRRPAPDDSRTQDIRKLYRQLCRSLHPDVASRNDDWTRQLWIEVQDAYESRDLDRLEALHASWELHEDPRARRNTLSQIMTAVKECLAGLNNTRQALRQARKKPAWKFASAPDSRREEIAAKLKRETTGSLNALRRVLNRASAQYDRTLSQGTPPMPAPPRERIPEGQGTLW